MWWGMRYLNRGSSCQVLGVYKGSACVLPLFLFLRKKYLTNTSAMVYNYIRMGEYYYYIYIQSSSAPFSRIITSLQLLLTQLEVPAQLLQANKCSGERPASILIGAQLFYTGQQNTGQPSSTKKQVAVKKYATKKYAATNISLKIF